MALELIILSEDSASTSEETVFRLLLKIFRKLNNNFDENKVFRRPTDEHITNGAIRGNLWKSTRAMDQSKIIDLIKYVSTELSRGRFVFWHIDGDRVWGNRRASENQQKFDEIILSAIKVKLGHLRESVNNFFLIVPFYSIEAWTYQNTIEARSLSKIKYSSKDLDIIESWAKDPKLLDEIEKVAESICLRKHHNLELVTSQHFTLSPHLVAQKSLHATLTLLGSSDKLRKSLCDIQYAWCTTQGVGTDEIDGGQA